MKIKICGMKYPENIQEVVALQPDYIGFIFYNKSKRFVLDDTTDIESFYTAVQNISPFIAKVGVFVNDEIKNVIKYSVDFDLQYVQLHGDESPEYCESLNFLDIKIIKAFGIDENFDFSVLNQYNDVCSYFLFDTKSTSYGGTGKKFDWTILKNYHLNKPIFLSGGLDITDILTLHDLMKNTNIHALDFNSKLEKDIALKDVEKCKKAIEQCRNVTMK